MAPPTGNRGTQPHLLQANWPEESPGKAAKVHCKETQSSVVYNHEQEQPFPEGASGAKQTRKDQEAATGSQVGGDRLTVCGDCQQTLRFKKCRFRTAGPGGGGGLGRVTWQLCADPAGSLVPGRCDCFRSQPTQQFSCSRACDPSAEAGASQPGDYGRTVFLTLPTSTIIYL